MPPNPGHVVRSPTGSWLAATAVSPPQVTSPAVASASQVNGTRVVSPPPEKRPARQDKKRLSLAFFKGGSTSETPSEPKVEKPTTEEQPIDTVSTTTSSRSRSKDNTKTSNRMSLSFLASPTSPPIEALPRFPSQPSSQHSLSQGLSRSQSTDKRPETSKSGKSEKSDHTRRGSVRKRLSILNIGKKSSKNSVKGRVDDTLAEE